MAIIKFIKTDQFPEHMKAKETENGKKDQLRNINYWEKKKKQLRGIHKYLFTDPLAYLDSIHM